MNRLLLDNIEKRFGDHVACSRVNLEIEQGEFFTLLGPSGCGKTTILRLIAGFLQPDAGTIRLGSRELTPLAPERRGVGMVFQNYALFPFLDVAGNVEYGLKQQTLSRRQRRDRVARYLEMVGLEGFGARRIDELSGGEQQRVALARSLAPEPAVLLLDEPLSNLDARLRERMRGELKTLQQQLGITTVFVTHDQSEALALSDRMAVFNHGRCIQVGRPEELYGEPVNVFVAGFLGEANLFPVTIGAGMMRLDSQPEVAFALTPPALGLKQETTGTLFIRPQDIALLPSGESRPAAPDRQHMVSGVVANHVFNGLTSDYLVRVAGVEFRVSCCNGIRSDKSAVATRPHLFKQGDEVNLAISPERLRLLPS